VTKIKVKQLIMVACFGAVLFLVAFAVRLDSRIRSEYVTASVITEVQHYVVENRRWPTNWNELPENCSKYTRLNFEADVSVMATNLKVLKKSVLPLYDHYIKYPHAERQLIGLQEALLNATNRGGLKPVQ
jgi:hypothetical protein